MASRATSPVRGSFDASSDPTLAIDAVTLPAWATISSRRSSHASAIPVSTWRNDGIP